MFDDIDVTLLPEVTSIRALRALNKFFGSADRDDVLLMYFSGHGKLDRNGRLHLCMQDTETTDLLATAVSSVRNDATIDNGTSYLTQHLVDGLLGAAGDGDHDGYVDFSDLYSYIDGRLRAGGKQIPQRRVDGEGDLRLARRPARPTGDGTPEPIAYSAPPRPAAAAAIGAARRSGADPPPGLAAAPHRDRRRGNRRDHHQHRRRAAADLLRRRFDTGYGVGELASVSVTVQPRLEYMPSMRIRQGPSAV